MARNPVSVKLNENVLFRAAIEIVQKNEGSTIKQRIQLSTGESGKRVEIVHLIDWKSLATLLKAAFHFTAGNPEATYNLGLRFSNAATEPKNNTKFRIIRGWI